MFKFLILWSSFMLPLLAWSGDLSLVAASPLGLVKISDGRVPVLLVHGIDPTQDLEEWKLPVKTLEEKGYAVYFHKWSKHPKIQENRELLLKSMTELLLAYPQSDLKVIGYSAGGAIALLALDSLQMSHHLSRVELHTVASPLFGYGAPVVGRIASPFVGRTTIEMGIGIIKKLKNRHLNQCFHWANTSCELDHHACLVLKKIHPQLGLVRESQEMPCGNQNTQTFDDEDHYSILTRVVSLLK